MPSTTGQSQLAEARETVVTDGTAFYNKYHNYHRLLNTYRNGRGFLLAGFSQPPDKMDEERLLVLANTAKCVSEMDRSKQPTHQELSAALND